MGANLAKICPHITNDRHSYLASSAIAANYPSREQYNLAHGLCGSGNCYNEPFYNQVTYSRHQYSKCGWCRHLQLWEHSIFHTHHIMIPTALMSFFQEGCVAKKNRLAQYIPVTVFFSRDVISPELFDLVIMVKPKLEHYTRLRLEKIPTPSNIEFPHAEKTLIIMGFKCGNILKKCMAPSSERFSWVLAHNFDIHDFQT